MKIIHTPVLRGISIGLLFILLLNLGANRANANSAFTSYPISPNGMDGTGMDQGQASMPPDSSYWVVRAYYTNREMVDELARWLEPWEVHPDEGYLVVGVNQSEYDRLKALGFRLEIDQTRTNGMNQPRQALPGQTSGVPGYPCYRTVEETYASAQALATAHPELATWIDIGDSWDKVHPLGPAGYDLMVLRLTSSAMSEPKPKAFIMASIHAREYAPAELATRFAEYLVDNYNKDPDVTWLLDYHEIHFLLQANPDGRKLAEADATRMWRKNTNQSYCSTNQNKRGADLNRNYEFQWGLWNGSSSNECDDTYHGLYPASEPETLAVQNYLRSIYPDQRGPSLTDTAPITTTGVFLDLHSYSDLVLWPWGFISTVPPNGNALQTLGRKFAYFNSYTPYQAFDLYVTDGTTDDFTYGDLGVAAYTFEMGLYTFFPDCSTFENTILPGNFPALLYAARISRTPYLTPAGPDVLSAVPSSLVVDTGAPVTLTATIDDTRYNNSHGNEPTQIISAAEFYIDIPYWVTTTTPIAHPMNAIDSSFDQKVEPVTAMLDTSSLSPGRHILFIRGQDAAGNWGLVTALFVYVLAPNKTFAPLIIR